LELEKLRGLLHTHRMPRHVKFFMEADEMPLLLRMLKGTSFAVGCRVTRFLAWYFDPYLSSGSCSTALEPWALLIYLIHAVC
jgi:hypothetical protein